MGFPRVLENQAVCSIMYSPLKRHSEGERRMRPHPNTLRRFTHFSLDTHMAEERRGTASIHIRFGERGGGEGTAARPQLKHIAAIQRDKEPSATNTEVQSL